MALLREVISSIHIYPIKSLQEATIGGEEPFELEVGPRGFMVGEVFDRDFVLYDDQEQCFITQRGWGIGAEKGGQKFKSDRLLGAVAVDVMSDHLRVSAPKLGSLDIPSTPIDGDTQCIDVFGKEFPCVDQGQEPARYFSKLLGRSIKLLRADRNQPRKVDPQYQREDAQNVVAGADGFPFLLVNQATLDAQHDLNGLVRGTVPINRYRGNIVIGGNYIKPGGEDWLDHVVINSVHAWVARACARCPIPNIDQKTGEIVGGGSAVLRGRIGVENGKTKKKMYFGQNLVHEWIDRESIAVGDFLTVGSLSESPNVRF
jgi:uncharacterized protein YcbX